MSDQVFCHRNYSDCFISLNYESAVSCRSRRGQLERVSAEVGEWVEREDKCKQMVLNKLSE